QTAKLSAANTIKQRAECCISVARESSRLWGDRSTAKRQTSPLAVPARPRRVGCVPSLAPATPRAKACARESHRMEAGEILIKRGLLNRGQLEQSRGIANGHGDGTKLIESAIQLGFVSEEQALKAVGEEVGIEFIDLAETEVELSLLKTFPQKLIHRQSLFPIRQAYGQLVVAT